MYSSRFILPLFTWKCHVRIYIDYSPPLPHSFAQLSSLGLNRIERTQPTYNHFLIKVPNCTDRLYLQESSGVYISKRELCCSWGNYKQALSPWRAANKLRLCQQFSSGLLLKQRNTLQSDLPYYGNDQSLSPCLGGGGRRKKKPLAKYLSCVIKEASLERISDVLKWGNNGVFKEQAGEDWVEEKHCRLTSTALEQWNKAKQQGGIINSLWWIAGVYLFLVWPNI